MAVVDSNLLTIIDHNNGKENEHSDSVDKIVLIALNLVTLFKTKDFLRLIG